MGSFFLGVWAHLFRWFCYANVIYIICQYFINHTVVNADGIKQIV
jgi:hypothetical protein